MSADPRIERIEGGIRRVYTVRPHPSPCYRCKYAHPCSDRQAADAALDRLDALWGTRP